MFLLSAMIHTVLIAGIKTILVYWLQMYMTVLINLYRVNVTHQKCPHQLHQNPTNTIWTYRQYVWYIYHEIVIDFRAATDFKFEPF